MNILAVSYMLPPNLYPQAIQVGRLLSGISANIGAVGGVVTHLSEGLDCFPEFERRLIFKLAVPFQPVLKGWAHRLACYALPFYGRTPDEFRGWVRAAEHATLDTLEKCRFAPDAMVTFGVPMSDHLLGLRLKRRLRLPWIAHFSDPWSDNPFRRAFVLSNILNRVLEAKVIEQADRIIFTSVETVDLVMAKYPQSWRKKVRVLPHGYEPSLYSPQGYTEDSLVVRYLGNFYGHRSPRPLFEALSRLLEESPNALKDVRVEVVGNVPGRMLSSPAYRQLPKGLVTIVKTVPYSESLRLMSESDLLLVIDAPDPLSVFLPSKLIDYIGAGVPILGIVPRGASASLIANLGGIVADPGKPTEVVHGLARALDESRIRKRKQPSIPWGKEDVRLIYRADRVAKALFEIIEEATGDIVTACSR